MGAHGGILASAHLAVGSFAELVRAWHSGDAVTAAALGHRLSRLSAALFTEPNPRSSRACSTPRAVSPRPGSGCRCCRPDPKPWPVR